jgi:ribose 5-phosphate isomerase B
MSQGPNQTLFIASDHAGYDLKSHFVRVAKDRFPAYTLKDLGPANADRVDYPDFAQALCKELLLEYRNSTSNLPRSFGILICGSGQGMAMAANRFKGIRAALTWNEESTRLARAHNDANILCLGARLIEPSLAVNLVETFLRTPFEGGRHEGRIEKIEC